MSFVQGMPAIVPSRLPLQELLEFTMVQQAQHYGDDELFDDYEGPYGELPSLDGSGALAAAAGDAMMEVSAAAAEAAAASSS